jgi:hypothetical protein
VARVGSGVGRGGNSWQYHGVIIHKLWVYTTGTYLFARVANMCVCVCVSEREREREKFSRNSRQE